MRSNGSWLRRASQVAAAVGLFAQGALAQEDDFARSGGYLGISGTYAGDASRVKNLSENSLGINARVGLRLAPNIAVEGEFEHLDGFDVAVAGTPIGIIESWVLTGNVKGLLLTGRIQPYFVAGMGVLRAKFVDTGGTLGSLDFPAQTRDTGFAVRLGGGVDVYVTRHLVVTLGASYVIPTGGVEDLDFLSVAFGAQYRF